MFPSFPHHSSHLYPDNRMNINIQAKVNNPLPTKENPISTLEGKIKVSRLVCLLKRNICLFLQRSPNKLQPSAQNSK